MTKKSIIILILTLILVVFIIFALVILGWGVWKGQPTDKIECRAGSDCAPCGFGCAPVEIAKKDFCHVGLQLNECECINNKCVVKSKEVIVPQDKESCEAQGGKWEIIGLRPEEGCNLPTSDAGQVCSDSNECDGLCIAELSKEDWDKAIQGVVYTKGKCTPWRITVGCLPVVYNGKVEGILCLD